jgi:hypothetical protein
MTLTELHSQLSELISQGHGGRLVIVSRDPEGNGFLPLEDVALSRYDRVEQDSGINDLTPELERQGFTEEDLLEGRNVCLSVTLWP